MKKMLMLSAAATAMLIGAPAMAQETTPDANTDAASATEVVVTGVRKSMRDALATKRAATGITEVVSSKDIGVLPDVTIAETLARLPGLNTVRDRGNDSQAAIRGLGPRMVLGLINGRELASSEPDRNVRWEVFPSEVVSGVVVYKSSQADIVSGGISGTVDIQTIRPLDYRGPALTLRGGAAYYDGGTSLPHQDDVGYRFSGAYVTKLTPNLGFVIAVSAQKQQNGYESVGGGGWNNDTAGNLPGPVTPGGPLVATPWGASMDVKAEVTDRNSVSSSLQWKPSDSFEGRIDVLASNVKLDEHDDGGWYTDWGNWGGYETGTVANPGFTNNVVRDGVLVKTDMTFNSTYHPFVSRYRQEMNLIATGANGKWSYDDWTVSADVAYSQAERYGAWQAVEMNNNAGKMSYDYTGDLPSVYAEVNAYQAAKNGTLFASNGQVDVSHLRDTLTSANFDASRHLNGGLFTTLKFGVRLSDRAKEDAEPGTVATAIPLSASTPVDSALVAPWNYKNFTVPTMITGDFDTLAKALYGSAGYTALNPDWKNRAFISKVEEKVAEAYVQGLYETTLSGMPVDGNIGLRVVSVDQSSFGPSNGVNITVSHQYTEVLPSATARIEISDSTYVKLGLSRALSRAPLNDLRVDRSFSTSGTPLTGGGGNPNLKPYIADQLDVAYEKYFRKDGLFAVALFTKRITNYIGYDTRQLIIPGASGPVTYTSPFNATKSGNLSGVEFTYQTPFYFIPALEKFGVYSNLALTSSNIKENSPVGNPFPMNGVAKTTGILDLWYGDDKLDARLGVKYHSPYTLLFTWASGGLQAIKAETSVDFSAGYKLNDHVTVRFQAANLLDTPLKLYDYNNPNEIARNDVYGRRFQVDLTLKY